MSHYREAVAACVAMFVCMGVFAGATMGQESTESALPNQLLQQLGSYRLGSSTRALDDVARRVHGVSDDAEERSRLAGALAGLLGEKDVTTDAKRFICRQLSLIGSARQAPALAALLADKDLSHMARYALERIPDKVAGNALRDALDALKGELLIGVINSLGERREDESVAKLMPLLDRDDADLVEAAAAALGKIGGGQAADALAVAKPPEELAEAFADALLRCAEGLLAAGNADRADAIYRELYAPGRPDHIRVAALDGLVSARGGKALELVLAAIEGEDEAMRAVACGLIRGKLPGEEATKALASLVAKSQPPTAEVLIDALAERGDKAARPAVLESLRHKDRAVRLSALQALASLGDASTAAVLAEVASVAAGAERDAARDSLAALRGKDVNDTIMKNMETVVAKERVELIRALAERKAVDKSPALLVLATEDDDVEARTAAIDALGKLAGPSHLEAMVKLLVEAKTDPEVAAAQKAIVAVFPRVADEEKRAAPVLTAYTGADRDQRLRLLPLLGNTGSARALEALRAALKGKDNEVLDAAVRSLGNWPDATAAEDLLEIARRTENATHNVLALRAYVRVVGLAGRRPPAELLKMYRAGMGAARRADEKKLILSGVANVTTIESLRYVEPYMEDAALREEAAAAVVAICRDILRDHREPCLQALEKVMFVSRNERTKRSARRLGGDALDRRVKEKARRAQTRPDGQTTEPAEGEQD